MNISSGDTYPPHCRVSDEQLSETTTADDPARYLLHQSFNCIRTTLNLSRTTTFLKIVVLLTTILFSVNLKPCPTVNLHFFIDGRTEVEKGRLIQRWRGEVDSTLKRGSGLDFRCQRWFNHESTWTFYVDSTIFACWGGLILFATDYADPCMFIWIHKLHSSLI
jgi:hypothetical protein